MSESAKELDELEGWKAIAGYLKVSVRTAQNFEKEHGLPVRRKLGIKAPVYALVPEVDEWVAQRGSTSGLPVHSPEAAPNSLPETPHTRETLGTFWGATAVLLAIATLAAVLFRVSQNPDGPPAALAIQGQQLIVRNSYGKELWRFEFPSMPETAHFYEPRFMERRTWIGELGDAGKTSVLVLFYPAEHREKIHRLYCFSESGQLLWEFVPGRTVKDGRGITMPPPYYVTQLAVIKGKRPEDTRIAVTSIHFAEQAGQIAFLDAWGRVRGEYWHPGHLAYMTQADIDGDGHNELLLGGADNAEHAAAIVALDPLQVNGLSTPRRVLDQAFRIVDLPEANEKLVVLFARGCVGKQAPYTRVRELWVTPSTISASVVDSFTEASDANIDYHFDHRFNLVNITPMPEYALRHGALEQAHELDHPYVQKREMDDLRRRMVIRRGGPQL